MTARDRVALTLAIGLATAVNVIAFTALWGALHNDGAGLSANGAQVLSTALGGIVGVLGSYFGFIAGRRERGTHGEP